MKSQKYLKQNNSEKEGKESKGDRYKPSSNKIDLSLTTWIIIFNVIGLNTPFKSQRFAGSV